jgi:hypothetical protein
MWLWIAVDCRDGGGGHGEQPIDSIGLHNQERNAMAERLVEPDPAAAPAMTNTLGREASWLGALVIGFCVMVLASATVLQQAKKLGTPYIESTQLQRHHAVTNNTAPTPWQYRVFSEWIVSGTFQVLSSAGVTRHEVVGYIGLRLAQNLAIFGVAALFYRRLGLSHREVALALALLAWSMSHSLDNSDLAVNTYFDVLFYLIAGWLVVVEQYWWILPLTAVAALNRETSALIPLLVISPLVLNPTSISRRDLGKVAISALGCVIFTAIFFGLRWYYGYREAWPWIDIGWPTLRRNLGDLPTLILLVLTFNVLPIITVWQLHRLPPVLRSFFWTVVPIWIAIHLVASLANETRLFLVPLALVLIPAAVHGGELVREKRSQQWVSQPI